MPSPSSVLYYVWIAIMMVNLFPTPTMLHKSGRIYRGVTWQSLVLSVLLFPVIVSVGVALAEAWPVLSWSWLQAFGAEKGANINFAPVDLPWLAPVFLVFLYCWLPVFAWWEEHWFRKGTKTWWDGAWRSLAFGMVHCLVGVPLAAGLAISLGGLWYTYHYFRGGVLRSTRYHLAWNLVAVSLLTLRVVLDFILWVNA